MEQEKATLNPQSSLSFPVGMNVKGIVWRWLIRQMESECLRKKLYK